jgi:acyl CoA:acetate/3-ketoacid CoA transferase alpha subunit
MQAVGGSIKGAVTPENVQTSVLAIQGTDTVASTYSLNGGYLIKGLNAGSYDLHFLPTDATLGTQVKTGVTVSTGNLTLVDTVRLN